MLLKGGRSGAVSATSVSMRTQLFCHYLTSLRASRSEAYPATLQPITSERWWWGQTKRCAHVRRLNCQMRFYDGRDTDGSWRHPNVWLAVIAGGSLTAASPGGGWGLWGGHVGWRVGAFPHTDAVILYQPPPAQPECLGGGCTYGALQWKPLGGRTWGLVYCSLAVVWQGTESTDRTSFCSTWLLSKTVRVGVATDGCSLFFLWLWSFITHLKLLNN